jgi:NAD-dependent SIR2 family protein deacetylase
MEETFLKAAEAIRSAQALVITAGAGMGVDSGLPDFRGNQGFWKAYPPYERLGLSFMEAANPVHFQRDPLFGWGFYGHRLYLYRETVPHAGFALLRKWADRFGLDQFVVTSNVDGQFQKAGFSEEQILEVHGSIHHLQCLTPCGMNIWPNREEVRVDVATMRSRSIPKCLHCGVVARPNILMFGDYSWISQRTDRQEERLQEFLTRHERSRLVIIECGAGTVIPTIRYLGERLGGRRGATLIRINPREPQGPAPQLSLPCSAVEGLSGIDAALRNLTIAIT